MSFETAGYAQAGHMTISDWRPISVKPQSRHLQLGRCIWLWNDTVNKAKGSEW